MITYNSTTWNDNGIAYANSSAISKILNNLIPYTNYNITIKAATKVGYGPQSPIIILKTFQSGKFKLVFIYCSLYYN